jgi:large subunit ribosomal protein L15
MKLNNLVKTNTKKIRPGRGIGSGKGKTGGRGIKGQKSRSGVAIKSFEGGQTPLYRRLPKRGFKSLSLDNTAIINLSHLQKFYDNKKIDLKEEINLKFLQDKKILNKKYDKLKVLGDGDLKNKVNITANQASKQAKDKIEKSGGILNIVKKIVSKQAVGSVAKKLTENANIPKKSKL